MADAEKAAQIIEGVLKDAELEWESPARGNYVVQLPGTRKLKTTVSSSSDATPSRSTPS